MFDAEGKRLYGISGRPKVCVSEGRLGGTLSGVDYMRWKMEPTEYSPITCICSYAVYYREAELALCEILAEALVIGILSFTSVRVHGRQDWDRSGAHTSVD